MKNLKVSNLTGMMLCFVLGLTLYGCATSNTNSTNNKDLLQAAAKGNEKEVSRLLADGADVSAKNTNGFTPLHAAAMHGHSPLCQTTCRVSFVN